MLGPLAQLPPHFQAETVRFPNRAQWTSCSALILERVGWGDPGIACNGGNLVSSPAYPPSPHKKEMQCQTCATRSFVNMKEG